MTRWLPHHKNKGQWSVNTASTMCQRSINDVSTQRQRSVNNLWSCKLHNPMALHQYIPNITILATFVDQNPTNNSATTSQKYVSEELQQVLWGSASFTATKCLGSFLNAVLNGQSYQYGPVYYLTTMHAVSNRSYYCLACSSRVNI